MSGTVDTVITVVLFVALIPALGVAFYAGFMLMMLGDGVTEARGFWGVVVGVVGVPLSALCTYVCAAVLAWRSDGHTFYYPIVALVVGGLLAWGISTLAARIAT